MADIVDLGSASEESENEEVKQEPAQLERLQRGLQQPRPRHPGPQLPEPRPPGPQQRHSPLSVASSLSLEDGLSGDVREDVFKSLAALERQGSFASSRNVESLFVDPQIAVHGIGTIPLPLTEHNAQALTHACHQAPFGKGEETIIDTSVRKTWELNPDRFSIQNPQWNAEFLPKVLRWATYELGAGRGVVGQLYKMLLYEKGAMFKAHKEYSDVEHEVNEVTSGYRWVLVYNLIAPSPGVSGLSAAAIIAETRRLQGVLRQWRREYDEGNQPEELTYLLEHQYTDASLNESSLKGHDCFVARALKHACSYYSFCYFLASFEHMKHGNAEPGYDPYRSRWYRDEESDEEDRPQNFHDIDDILEETVRLTRVIDPSGTVVARDLGIYLDDIIPANAFDDVDPDDEDYEGFTGNAGATTTHWYRRTAIVIMPKEHVGDFLLEQFRSRFFRWGDIKTGWFESSINYLVQQQMEEPHDLIKKQTLESVCKCALEKAEERLKESLSVYNRNMHNKVAGAMIRGAITLRNVSMFERAMAVAYEPPIEDFAAGLSEWISQIGFFPLQRGLQLAVPEDNVIYKHVNYLFGLKEKVSVDNGDRDKGAAAGLISWINRGTEKILQTAPRLWAEDGIALEKVLRLSNDHVSSLEKILPVLKKHARFTPVLIIFVIEMWSKRFQLSEDVFQSALKAVAAYALQYFNLAWEPKTICHEAHELYMPARPHHDPYLPRQWRSPLDGKHLASFMTILVDQKLEAETEQLAQRIADQASTIKLLDFEAILLPFLRILSTRGSILNPPFKSMSQAVVAQCAHRYLGPPPQRKSTWARLTVPCNCHDCAVLNLFLGSPVQRVAHISVNKERRRHLHGMLDRWPKEIDCTHTTLRSGRPQTLVVTKQETTFKNEMGEWHRRRKNLRDNLRGLGAAVNLDELLGCFSRFIVLALMAEEDLQEDAIRVLSELGQQQPQQQPAILAAQTAPAAQTASTTQTAPAATPRRPQLSAIHSTPAATSSTPPSSSSRPSASAISRPLAPTSGNSLPPPPPLQPSTPSASSFRRSASTPLKNTPESRASVKRKAAESGVVDLASFRNTEEMRKQVKREVEEVEVLDLTGE